MFIWKSIEMLKYPKNNIKTDKIWLRKIAELPCLICKVWDETVCGHHLKMGVPRKRKSGDNHTLPLCWTHHTGPEGVELHGNETEWFASHGIYNAPGMAEHLYELRGQPEAARNLIGSIGK